MDTNIEKIFSPVRAVIMSGDYGMADIFGFIAGFTLSSPEVAHAFSRHMIDFLEEKKCLPWQPNEAIAECYRRTFFDREKATLYGTEGLLDQGEERMQDFANYIVTSIQADRLQAASSSPTDTVSPTRH